MRASLVYHIRFINRNKNARNEVANKLIFETRKGFAMMFGLKVILIQQKNHFYTFSIWIEQLLYIFIDIVIKSQWNFWTQFRSVFQMIGKGTNFHEISKKKLELSILPQKRTKNEKKLSWKLLCPIHVVTFTLISNLATDFISKIRKVFA